VLFSFREFTPTATRLRRFAESRWGKRQLFFGLLRPASTSRRLIFAGEGIADLVAAG